MDPRLYCSINIRRTRRSRVASMWGAFKQALFGRLFRYMVVSGLVLCVAFTKFEAFSEHLAEKVHDLNADQLMVALSVDAPSASLDAVLADLTSHLSTANGYTSGGADTQNATSRTGGTTSITGVDIVWTASGGSVGPFRYAILYNTTPTSPADPLIGYWDYGSNVTLADGETFTVDFGASMFTIA